MAPLASRHRGDPQMSTRPDQAAAASAPDIVREIVDEGSLRSWNTPLDVGDPMGFVDRKPYSQRLADAKRASRGDEAVWTGSARIGGIACAVIASDFDFMAGTMGIAAGIRICRAFDRAIEQRLPVIGLPTSGGTRMQEGTPAFVQMANVAAAV